MINLENMTQTLTVVLGETQKTIKEIGSLGDGSYIELDSFLGEPVEIRANDLPIATGEVISRGERFGIRVTRLLSKEEQQIRLSRGRRKFLTEIKMA